MHNKIHAYHQITTTNGRSEPCEGRKQKTKSIWCVCRLLKINYYRKEFSWREEQFEYCNGFQYMTRFPGHDWWNAESRENLVCGEGSGWIYTIQAFPEHGVCQRNDEERLIWVRALRKIYHFMIVLGGRDGNKICLPLFMRVFSHLWSIEDDYSNGYGFKILDHLIVSPPSVQLWLNRFSHLTI